MLPALFDVPKQKSNNNSSPTAVAAAPDARDSRDCIASKEHISADVPLSTTVLDRGV